MALGVVKVWHMEEGWGVITSPELPPGHDAWSHFSLILAEGYRYLEPGDRVEFEPVRRDQDGYAFVATDVRKL